jgi:beta-N-acetylhexosaminidase
MLPIFFGISGPALSADEISFFQEVRPAGYILFARNIVSREQVRALTDQLRALNSQNDSQNDLPILIDQEGGRVARLRPPLTPEFPSARMFGSLYRRDVLAALEATRANAALIAHDLRDLGINVNCLPVLDVPVAGAHDVIGDRAYGMNVDMVTALGAATLSGLHSGGVVSVIKHIPGHGRAQVDSHADRPIVQASAEELAQDIAPFAGLSSAPMAMVSHVVYTAYDADRPASQSPIIIADIIRKRIGFDGLLMTDDIAMKALSGDFSTRAAAAIAAGCDIVLHCSGDLSQMREVAHELPAISNKARDRLSRAMQISATPAKIDFDKISVTQRRDALLELAYHG